MSSHRRRDENSGLIDLDALLRQADSSPEVAPPPSAPALPAPAAPLARAADSLEGLAAAAPPPPPERVAAPSPVERAPAPRRRGLVALAGLAALLSVLAVARVAHVPGAPRAAAAAPPLAAPAGAREASPAPGAAPVPPASPSALAPASLPAAPAAPAPGHGAAPGTKASRLKNEEPAGRVTEKELAAAGGEASDLGDAMRSAVGPRDDAARGGETARSNGARQVRPSLGAVVGAINAVLPEARACLSPDASMRNGSLTFASDGSVARVDLRGAKDEDACVRSALAKARVEPFAEDTFVTRVTVRP